MGQERPLVSKSAFIQLKDLEPHWELHWNVYRFLGIISFNVHSTGVLWDQEFKRNSPLFSNNPVLWREADMFKKKQNCDNCWDRGNMGYFGKTKKGHALEESGNVSPRQWA